MQIDTCLIAARIKKQQVADIKHIGTSSGHLWFRIMDTHHGRGKSISSIWKENLAENIRTSERKTNYGEFDETMN